MPDNTRRSPRVLHPQPPSPLHLLPLLLLLLLLLHPHVGLRCWAIRPAFTCPSSCACSGSSHSSGGGVNVVDVLGLQVKCSAAGLAAVPDDLPVATSRLLLDSNRIFTLPPGALRHLPALRELDLSGNLLDSVLPGAFDGAARSLELVDLSANRLRSLRPAALAGLAPAVGMFLHGNPWHCDCELVKALSRVTVLGPGVVCATAEKTSDQAGRGGDAAGLVRDEAAAAGGGAGGGGLVASVGFGGVGGGGGGGFGGGGAAAAAAMVASVGFGGGGDATGAFERGGDSVDDAMTLTMMCTAPAKTTDVAMLVTMLGWFSVVIGYIICYARQNREDVKKEVAQPSAGGPGTPFDDDVGTTTL